MSIEDLTDPDEYIEIPAWCPNPECPDGGNPERTDYMFACSDCGAMLDIPGE